jgi:membrane protein required for colicin V production
VTLFDLIAGLVLLASALVGLARGATREVTTVIAFAIAVVLAVLGWRFVSPIVQQAIHIVWIANTAAILLIFLFVYVVLRLGAGALTRRVQQTAGLSGFDRILGLLIGAVRGLVVIGAFALLLNAITPDPKPDWMTKARLYPVAMAVGDGLREFAPKTFRGGHEVAGATQGPGQWPSGHDPGYSRRVRKSLDVLVEKSR